MIKSTRRREQGQKRRQTWRSPTHIVAAGIVIVLAVVLAGCDQMRRANSAPPDSSAGISQLGLPDWPDEYEEEMCSPAIASDAFTWVMPGYADWTTRPKDWVLNTEPEVTDTERIWHLAATSGRYFGIQVYRPSPGDCRGYELTVEYAGPPGAKTATVIAPRYAGNDDVVVFIVSDKHNLPDETSTQA